MAMLVSSHHHFPEEFSTHFPVDVDDANLPSSTSAATLVSMCGRKRPLRLDVRFSGSQDTHLSKKQKTTTALLASKKLSLVLDLDHTLLHTVNFSKLSQSQQDKLGKEEEKDIGRPQRHLFRLKRLQCWTKLRLGIWTFLEKASKLFELHICTMGGPFYAQEMAKLLDPTGALFGGRVVSKRDAKPKVKDLDDVLGTESIAVIIDDTVEVWPRNEANLICAPNFNRKDDEDTALTSLYTILERIHQQFFSYPVLSEVDVRNVIAAEQGKVLAGCCLHISKEFQTPEADSICQKAQRFGAKCTTGMADHITHVLSNCLASEEAKWALSAGKFVVKPNWIETSASLYQRANEEDFLPNTYNRLKVLLRQPS